MNCEVFQKDFVIYSVNSWHSISRESNDKDCACGGRVGVHSKNLLLLYTNMVAMTSHANQE